VISPNAPPFSWQSRSLIPLRQGCQRPARDRAGFFMHRRQPNRMVSAPRPGGGAKERVGFNYFVDVLPLRSALALGPALDLTLWRLVSRGAPIFMRARKSRSRSLDTVGRAGYSSVSQQTRLNILQAGSHPSS
jgi:hypothetical protein